jgi:hypothetical protein
MPGSAGAFGAWARADAPSPSKTAKTTFEVFSMGLLRETPDTTIVYCNSEYCPVTHVVIGKIGRLCSDLAKFGSALLEIVLGLAGSDCALTDSFESSGLLP